MLIICSLPIYVGFVGDSSPEPEAESRRLPILMYHAVLNGRKGKYIVSEKQLEKDFEFIKKQGYETVFLSEVINWIDGRGTLPSKPLVLTFDDGHYNNMHYALPLARKHGIKFMVFPVTSYSRFTTESGDHSNANYSHLTWEQIREMNESGYVEFGSHTHAMHKMKPRFGVLRMRGEDSSVYREKVMQDLEKAQSYFTQESKIPAPQTFAYPFGKFNDESQKIVEEFGFRAILTCTEGVSVIERGNPKGLLKLKRYNRDGHRDTEEVFRRLEPR